MAVVVVGAVRGGFQFYLGVRFGAGVGCLSCIVFCKDYGQGARIMARVQGLSRLVFVLSVVCRVLPCVCVVCFLGGNVLPTAVVVDWLV